MGLIKIYMLLFSISSAQALIFKRKVECFLPSTIFLIIILEYFGGLSGNLRIGYLSVLILAGGCGAYCIKKLSIDLNSAKVYLLTPGVLIFFIAAALLHQYNMGRLLSEWDEFTHWGVVAKDMYIRNVFGNSPGGNLYFPDYPPGTALFQYFILQFAGVYTEHYLYLAQNLLCLSLLSSVFERFEYRHWKTILIFTIALAIFPLNFFSYFYHTVYVDAILGFIFGYILFIYFRAPQKNNIMWYQLGLSLFSLVLVKESGFGLALICLCIILLDYAVLCGRRYKAYAIKAGFIIGMTLMPKLSWSSLLYRLGIENHFDKSGISIRAIVNVFFAGHAEAYQSETIENFGRALFGTSKAGGTLSTQSYIRYILILAALMIAIYLLKKSKHIVWLGISLFLGFMMYAFYTLLLYLFSHTELAAVNLASFDRYEYTYVIGMLLSGILLLIDSSAGETKLRTLSSVSLLAMCFSMSVFVPRLIFNSEPEIEATRNIRKNYMFAEEFKEILNKPNHKVYIVNQYDPINGLGYWMLRYHLDPVKTQHGKWSIGIPKDDTDLQTIKISAAEWRQELEQENYTHVLLYGIDDTFKKYFSEVFEDSDSINDKALFYFKPETGKLVEVHP